ISAIIQVQSTDKEGAVGPPPPVIPYPPPVAGDKKDVVGAPIPMNQRRTMCSQRCFPHRAANRHPEVAFVGIVDAIPVGADYHWLALRSTTRIILTITAALHRQVEIIGKDISRRSVLCAHVIRRDTVRHEADEVARNPQAQRFACKMVGSAHNDVELGPWIRGARSYPDGQTHIGKARPVSSVTRRLGTIVAFVAGG